MAVSLSGAFAGEQVKSHRREKGQAEADEDDVEH
jgi:hypothetical protein